MEINAYTLAVIAGGFTVVGALIGAISAYWLSTHLEQIKDHRAACAKLRSAFAPVLAQLDLGRKHNTTHDAPDIDNFLMSQLLANAAAIEEFKPFVNTSDVAGYEQAWGEYYEAVKGGLFVAKSIGEEEPHSAIQNKIHAVLTYAKTQPGRPTCRFASFQALVSSIR